MNVWVMVFVYPVSMFLEIVVGPNTTEVRIALTYKHRPSPIWCETFNTPPHDQHYWAWFVDINGGWPDIETW